MCSGPGTRNLAPTFIFRQQTLSPRLQWAWDLKSATKKRFLLVDLTSHCAAGLALEIHHWKSRFGGGLQVLWQSGPWTPSLTLEIIFLCVGLQVPLCSGPETWKLPPENLFWVTHCRSCGRAGLALKFQHPKSFFCWTSSPTVQRACDSKSTPENQILVVDFTSCDGVGLTLKSDTGNHFFWLDFKSYGRPGLGLEIQHQKSFFSVGLQVQGCSGCGTWNFPQKISFCWWTSSLMVEQACHSSPTPEIIFCVSPTVQWAWDLKSAPKNPFWWCTSSPRVQQAWDSKSDTKNYFLVVDFKSEPAAGLELKMHPWKSFSVGGLQVLGCSWAGTWNLLPKMIFGSGLWVLGCIGHGRNSTTPPKMIFFWQTSSPKRW